MCECGVLGRFSRTWLSVPCLPFSRGSAANFTSVVNTLLPDAVLRWT